MNEKIFNKGEVIFHEGETGKSFFQITDGTAGVYLHYGEENQRKLADMRAGQFFGEMAVIDAWPRSTTVVAEDSLHVIEIDEGMLNEYFREKPDMIRALICQLGRRLFELTVEYEEVNAVIREKQEVGAEHKEGFLARMTKILEMNNLIHKASVMTEEEKLVRQSFRDQGKDSSRVLSFKKGQIIFREGDEGKFMYAVYGGAVGIYLNYGMPEEKRLTTLYPDTFFGEMGLVMNEPRSATAVVEEDDTLLECIREEDLQALFEENPIKIYMIVSHLSHRLRTLTRDYYRACAIAAGE